MLIDIGLGSKAIWRILILFCEAAGAGITRPEIREHTHLGNKAIDRSLNMLKRNKLIMEEKIGRKTIYKLKLTNPYIVEIQNICKVEKEQLNNLPYGIALILRELVRKILDCIAVEHIDLFGSIAKRIYREDSDIDIALIGKKKITTGEKLEITDIEEEIEKRFKRKIQIHYFAVDEFEELRKKNNPLVIEIIKDRIRLIG